jgi:hypothetical protein
MPVVTSWLARVHGKSPARPGLFSVGRKTQIAGLDNAIQPDAAPPEAREKGRKIRIIAAIRPK